MAILCFFITLSCDTCTESICDKAENCIAVNTNTDKKNCFIPCALVILEVNHSHSIVAGGLLLISYTTLLMPLTLLMISLEISAKNS
jgi:hypothetical protein